MQAGHAVVVIVRMRACGTHGVYPAVHDPDNRTTGADPS